MRELPRTSPVLRSDEAVEYLRMDQDHRTVGDAVKALHRLVREAGLRPIGGMRPYRFSIVELDRWIDEQTAGFTARLSTKQTTHGDDNSGEVEP